MEKQTIKADHAGIDPSLPAASPLPIPAGTPAPVVAPNLRAEHPELYEAWVKHIRAGYENNDQVFQRILDAFLRSHNSSVIMYWVLFAIGIGFFVTSVALALLQDSPGTGVLFGGLSIAAFIAYFVSRPTQAVEENLQYVTWLGIIYNSYWTRLAWSFDEKTAQQVLDDATEDAIRQLNTLIDKHAVSVRGRPGITEQAPGLDSLLGAGKEGGA